MQCARRRRLPAAWRPHLGLHRDYPGGFAVGSLTFGATAMLINADALDDAERAMDVVRADADAMALPDLIAASVSSAIFFRSPSDAPPILKPP